jgi:hypothetical protein
MDGANVRLMMLRQKRRIFGFIERMIKHSIDHLSRSDVSLIT